MSAPGSVPARATRYQADWAGIALPPRPPFVSLHKWAHFVAHVRDGQSLAELAAAEQRTIGTIRERIAWTSAAAHRARYRLPAARAHPACPYCRCEGARE